MGRSGGAVTNVVGPVQVTVLEREDHEVEAPTRVPDRRPSTADRMQVAALVLLCAAAAFVGFFRLGTPSWHGDEIAYRKAGLAYVEGDFRLGREHPPLVKYILGAVGEAFGTSAGVVRLPAALASLAIGAVLFAFGRRIGGRWCGGVAFALWALLPHALRGADGEVLWLRIDRMALLEPFLALFVMLALYLGWRWAESGSWSWAAAAGAALGCAVATKSTGILVLPALGIAGLVLGARSRRWGRAVAQGVVVVGVAAITVALAYLPFGTTAPAAVRFMFEFQGEHARQGHVVLIRDTIYGHSPWWAHVWWDALAFGLLPFVALGLAAGSAILAHRRSEVVMLAAAGAVPALILAFAFGFGLPHYHYIWDAPLTLLAAVGIVTLARRRQATATALLVVIGAPLLVAGAWTVWRTAHTRPAGYSVATADLRGSFGEHPRILLRGDPVVVHAYLPGADVSTASTDVAAAELDAVILDDGFTRRFPDPAVDAILAAGPFMPHDEGAGITLYVREPPPGSLPGP